MPDALKRAEHYHDLARRYLHLAASAEKPNHYLRIAVQYNVLAEAEELTATNQTLRTTCTKPDALV